MNPTVSIIGPAMKLLSSIHQWVKCRVQSRVGFEMKRKKRKEEKGKKKTD